MADVKASDLFGLPITGGNALTTAQLILAREQMMDDGSANLNRVHTALERHIRDKHATYTWWQLLQMQVDYWANLLPFAFKGDHWLTTNAMKALRACAVYGVGGVKHEDGKIIPLAINVLTKDRYGMPARVQGMHADNVLWSQANPDQREPNWLNAVEEDVGDDVYIFQSNAYGWGMLTKWRPFLRQLEDILIMLSASSYVSFKRVIYNVADVSAYDTEIGLLYSPYSAVICNVSPDGLTGNKFKEFDVSGAGTDGYFLYLDKLLETYYSLLGRRSNVDFKPERNISDEVGANQEAFDFMQSEWKTQVRELLDGITQKTGKQWDSPQEKEDGTERNADGMAGERNNDQDMGKPHGSE